MTEQTQDQAHDQETMSRRGFLKAAALTTAAAAATGAGVAYVGTEVVGTAATPAPPVAAAPVSGPAAAVPAAPPSAAQSELFAQLAAAQAENLRLKTALDAATREAEALRQAQEQPNEAVEILQADLNAAHGRITVLAGLVGLYEQLEKLDLGEKLTDSMDTVSEAFTDLVDDLPTLQEGVALGREALDEFEEHIPLLENGRSWLDRHLGKLDGYYTTFEQVLQEIAERAAPVLDMLQEWFDKIMKWLPFGFGRASLTVMAAVTDLIRETPNTLQGTDVNIAQPLDVWLKKENGETATPLQKRLVHPLRNQTISTAENTAAKAEQLKSLYDEQFVARLSDDVANKQLIQQIIADYRAKHEV